MRKENTEDTFNEGQRWASDKEDFQLIPKGRYSLDMPRIWRREIWLKDKKGTVSLRMNRSCWAGKITEL